MFTIFPKKFLAVAAVLFIIQLLFFNLVLAEENTSVKFKPQVGIPGTEFQKGAEISIPRTTAKIGEYIKGLYIFLISALALLSVVMIAWAGITWLTAGGSPEKVGTAKAHILGALGGLALGLVSYVILQTINPALVDFKISSIAPVDPLYMQNVVTNKLCDASMKDAQGQPIKCGLKYSAQSPDITKSKKEQEIEGCMGFYCSESPFIRQIPGAQKGVCQLFKDSNDNYTGGGCWTQTFVPVKDSSGQTLYRKWGPSDIPLGTFSPEGDCGETIFKLDESLLQLLGLSKDTGYSLWIGTVCSSGQTCTFVGDAVKLSHTFGQSTASDFLENLKTLFGVSRRAENMSCEP